MFDNSLCIDILSVIKGIQMAKNIIIDQFKQLVISYFDNESSFELFLITSSTALGDKSPKQFLLESNRSDKLEFAVETVKQLKATMDFSYE